MKNTPFINDMNNICKRNFVKATAIMATGVTIVPGTALGKSFGHVSSSDKSNIAGIGIGGVGRRNLANRKTESIALCDVDWQDYRDYTVS